MGDFAGPAPRPFGLGRGRLATGQNSPNPNTPNTNNRIRLNRDLMRRLASALSGQTDCSTTTSNCHLFGSLINKPIEANKTSHSNLKEPQNEPLKVELSQESLATSSENEQQKIGEHSVDSQQQSISCKWFEPEEISCRSWATIATYDAASNNQACNNRDAERSFGQCRPIASKWRQQGSQWSVLVAGQCSRTLIRRQFRNETRPVSLDLVSICFMLSARRHLARSSGHYFYCSCTLQRHYHCYCYANDNNCCRRAGANGCRNEWRRPANSKFKQEHDDKEKSLLSGKHFDLRDKLIVDIIGAPRCVQWRHRAQ